jgi:F-type H+-transporting ATPase subunit gamma
MEDITRVKARLANIRSIEPILEALRTISIGVWQMALKQQGWLREYEGYLGALLSALLPTLAALRCLRSPNVPASPQRLAALVIGSERGLCGGFNHALVGAVEEYMQGGRLVELWALGARLSRLLRRRAREPVWSGSLPTGALPPFAIAWELSHLWLADYETYRLDAVDLIYNAYRGPGVYTPVVFRLLPPESPLMEHREVWPPPIVETEPQRIFARVLEQQVALRLYRVLLESAASEHSARFQLMESATQNAERLVEELTQVFQAVRQHTVTREMQELAVGAGLVGPRRESG